MDAKDFLSLIFAAIALVGVLGGIANRLQMRKGLGSQFIRFIALVVALPLAGALAFQGMIAEGVVSLILGILGYIFPGSMNDG